jgi:hypothetical protein
MRYRWGWLGLLGLALSWPLPLAAFPGSLALPELAPSVTLTNLSLVYDHQRGRFLVTDTSSTQANYNDGGDSAKVANENIRLEANVDPVTGEFEGGGFVLTGLVPSLGIRPEARLLAGRLTDFGVDHSGARPSFQFLMDTTESRPELGFSDPVAVVVSMASSLLTWAPSEPFLGAGGGVVGSVLPAGRIAEPSGLLLWLVAGVGWVVVRGRRYGRCRASACSASATTACRSSY